MQHPLIHYTPTNHILQTNIVRRISINYFAICEEMKYQPVEIVLSKHMLFSLDL